MSYKFFRALALEDEVYEISERSDLASTPAFREFFSLPYGAVSSDGAAVVGREGYLFVNDGSNQWRSQIRGDVLIDEAALAETYRTLDLAAEGAAEVGASFLFVVFPEKDIVHDEHSPNAESGVSERRSVHLILGGQTRPALYPADALRRMKLITPVFHARNSHVNLYGGYAVAEAVFRSLGIDPPDPAHLSLDFVQWPDDLSKKFVDNLNTRRRILRPVYRETVIKKSERNVGNHVILRQANARTSERAIVFGDSYSWNVDAGLARYLCYHYGEVHCLWEKRINWELVREVLPSFICLQSAERFLVRGISTNK